MTAFRLARIAAIAIGFVLVFTLSQRATVAREGQTLPGIAIAIGVLSVIFLLGAYATERSQGPEANSRKDLFWGLGTGGIGIALAQLA